jgi:hypothetical protein
MCDCVRQGCRLSASRRRPLDKHVDSELIGDHFRRSTHADAQSGSRRHAGQPECDFAAPDCSLQCAAGPRHHVVGFVQQQCLPRDETPLPDASHAVAPTTSWVRAACCSS